MRDELLDIPVLIGAKEHERRMAVARRYAQWELGDASWADGIIGAYLSPDSAAQALDDQQAPEAPEERS